MSGTIFSVVQTCGPDCVRVSSYRPGRWEVVFYFDSETAIDYARRCNEHRNPAIAACVRYSVEEIAEDSPNRAPEPAITDSREPVVH